jgi:hypothetical protein
MRCLRLPFRFDPGKLRTDLAGVAADEWIPHLNRRRYDGRWCGAALRSIAGSATHLVPDAHGAESFEDTALLRRSPYYQTVLATLRCPIMAARLLKFDAGSHVAEHVDHALDFEDGEVRLHMPVVTSDDVRFHLDGQRLVMAPGECWQTNVNLPHAVGNRGATDRIPLVIDCRVDDWLRQVFATAPQPRGDNHTARVRLPAATPASAQMALFATAAATLSPPTAHAGFHSKRGALVLHWPRRWSGHLRLNLPMSPADPAAGGWIAEIETSPDPDRFHRSDFEAFLALLKRQHPEADIAAVPVP